ncbi:MAG: Holliday junction branch migration protein RuvA [Chloroflexi bacterium]|nr:MAG: Holliday junction branch migration protein RuvA [Phototrophicales bacterium]RMF76971.1 MAG: Holliday junction branch migration protein RuvA [Chloroflexota bacterium]
MIASIQGRVTTTGDDYVVLTTGGIGYQIYTPSSVLQQIDTSGEAFLYTALIVREDSLTLYGFATIPERELFETLIGVTGVGPRLALAILSTLSVDNLRHAVVSERAEILTRVSGIGKKTAQKIVFELKDKFPIGLDAIPVDSFDDVNSDVFDTLVALGYSVVEAQAAIQTLPSDAPDDVEERVRLALEYFL